MRLQPLPAGSGTRLSSGHFLSCCPPERWQPAGRPGNALSTFARHPALAKAFLRFNIHLLYSSTLPPRVANWPFLRVAHRRDCDYEWTPSCRSGQRGGLRDEEIAAVRQGGDGWAAGEFECRGAHRGRRTRREVPVVRRDLGGARHPPWNGPPADGLHLPPVGCYTMLAMAFNTFWRRGRTGLER